MKKLYLFIAAVLFVFTVYLPVVRNTWVHDPPLTPYVCAADDGCDPTDLKPPVTPPGWNATPTPTDDPGH